jgi:hypothetical protein
MREAGLQAAAEVEEQGEMQIDVNAIFKDPSKNG